MNDYQDVLAYLKLAFKRRKKLYVSDISEALGMGYDKVHKICERMRREDKIEYTDAPRFKHKTAS